MTLNSRFGLGTPYPMAVTHGRSTIGQWVYRISSPGDQPSDILVKKYSIKAVVTKLLNRTSEKELDMMIWSVFGIALCCVLAHSHPVEMLMPAPFNPMCNNPMYANPWGTPFGNPFAPSYGPQGWQRNERLDRRPSASVGNAHPDSLVGIDKDNDGDTDLYVRRNQLRSAHN
ncbi:unnamed protein product [Calicophoron daubneyi]|uniref:Uncharacterized protein n=1 Tax=Calicophoron daubneyi TaxID=300641 RepID=A0AAV2T4C2_CALDB